MGLCGRLGLHPVELLSLRFGPGLGTLVPLDRVGRMRGELACKDILTPAMLRWLRRADCPTRVQVDLRDGIPLLWNPEEWDFPDHEPVAREQLLWASEWSNSLWLHSERKPAPDLPLFDPYMAGERETVPVP